MKYREVAVKSKRTLDTDGTAFGWTEQRLVGAALALGACEVESWRPEELSLAGTATSVPDSLVAEFRRAIELKQDPLGEVFARLRSTIERRSVGATYTPLPIVRLMTEWASLQTTPERVVDPGCGSGRFLVEAGGRFPKTPLIGVDIDPLATIIARANLAASGLAKRSAILLEDFRQTTLPQIVGRTLYIGNPPYVRHHEIESKWKDWLTREGSALGVKTSQLAGLHVHFMLAIASKASEEDFGTLITSAEWLDVNYGQMVREMFLGRLGGQGIVVIDPKSRPFADAATTAAVSMFEINSKPKRVRLTKIKTLADLTDPKATHLVRRERLESELRWSHLTRSGRKVPEDFVELGELCRVHRGTVTGANKVWIAGKCRLTGVQHRLPHEYNGAGFQSFQTHCIF